MQRVVFVSGLLAIVIVAALFAFRGTTSSSETDTGHCRNGVRMADVLIVLRRDISLDEQVDFTLREYTPGQDKVAGTKEFATAALLPGKPFMYIYTDVPLSRSQRRDARREAEKHIEIERLEFNVRPVGGAVPSGECS